MRVWIVTGQSEYGDDYMCVFKEKQSNQQLEKLAHEWDGDECREGPGLGGSYVYITQEPHEVIQR